VHPKGCKGGSHEQELVEERWMKLQQKPRKHKNMLDHNRRESVLFIK